MPEVMINTSTIKLDQFLKWAGIVPSGGLAKQMIIEGLVRVNGYPEKRRGKMIQRGDTVEIEGYGTFIINSTTNLT